MKKGSLFMERIPMRTAAIGSMMDLSFMVIGTAEEISFKFYWAQNKQNQ